MKSSPMRRSLPALRLALAPSAHEIGPCQRDGKRMGSTPAQAGAWPTHHALGQRVAKMLIWRSFYGLAAWPWICATAWTGEMIAMASKRARESRSASPETMRSAPAARAAATT